MAQDAEIAPKEEFSCAEEVQELKWRVLVFVCFLTLGGYYIYDFPGSIGIAREHSISAHFENKGKEFTNEMNQALYSVYSWPNTVVATIGGILIDNYLGLRKSLMLFVTLDALGALVFYFGVVATNFPVMLLGRFIFGLGNESLSVAQNSFVARYFRGKWGIALAFGMVISFSRVGSSFNFLFSPRLATSYGIDVSVLMGFVVCMISVGAALVVCCVDLYAERVKAVPPQAINKSTSEGGGFSLKLIKELNVRVWLIFLITIASYCAVFPFVGVAKNFFEVKYNVVSDTASTYMSFFQFACAGFSPLSGGVVDRVGRTVFWMMAAGIGFGLIHFVFLVASPPPVAMTIVMGVVYSILASSLWPAVPFVVAPSAVGLAYGLMNSLQNIGLAIYPLIVGAILDHYTPPKAPQLGLCYNWSYDDGFDPKLLPSFAPLSLENCTNHTHNALPHLQGFELNAYLFMFTAFAGAAIAFVLLILDKRGDGILSADSAERRRIYHDKLDQWQHSATEASRLLGSSPSPAKPSPDSGLFVANSHSRDNVNRTPTGLTS